jgi:TRAP-type C4-dicarboxylate transport system permease small subunit
MMRKLYDNLEEIAGSALLIVLCLVATLQVVGRYLFATPLAWTEEFATIIFAWLVFVGCALALKKREHFVIEIFVDLLPGAPQRLVRRLALALVLLVSGGLVVFGIRLCLFNAHVHTPVLEVSRSWIYAAVPVGGLLMFLRCLPQLRDPHPDHHDHEEVPPA